MERWRRARDESDSAWQCRCEQAEAERDDWHHACDVAAENGVTIRRSLEQAEAKCDETIGTCEELQTLLSQAEAENKALTLDWQRREALHERQLQRAVDEISGSFKRAEQAEADLAAMTKERDEARELQRRQFISATYLRNQSVRIAEMEQDLAAAREEARKWEWVARKQRETPSTGRLTVPTRGSTRSARYQPAEENPDFHDGVGWDAKVDAFYDQPAEDDQ